MTETKLALENEQKFLVEHAKMAKKANRIDPSLFDFYNAKRGLRNEDGTGVLVGLTEIGSVHGYIVDEKEKVPVDGSLHYRGINIFDLVTGFISGGRFGFEESVYLLLFGKLPTAKEFEEFLSVMEIHREVEDVFIDTILKAPSRNVMNKLARSVLTLYSFDRNPEGRSMKTVLRQCLTMIAKFPSILAYAYQAKSHYYDRKSLFIHRPLAGLSTAENFLRLIRPDGKFTKVEAETLDLALVLHAEHGGGNNSTFTTHVVSSSDTDVFSSIAAAIGSLKGLKHGGANIKVAEMFDNIKDNVKDWNDEGEVASYIEKIIKKEAFNKTGLVYGMGHAVYTKSDPRAIVLKKKVEELVAEKDRQKEYNLYQNVEKVTPGVFAEVKGSDKVISANVDFYSGFVYDMLGIPRDLYTAIFAMARIAGWSAHLIEEMVSGGRIIRPAYKSVSKPKDYTDIKTR
ncbi:MAG: citrate/2-methylcitrate synthase [Sedimentisphaeraceae bacterium JB056]